MAEQMTLNEITGIIYVGVLSLTRDEFIKGALERAGDGVEFYVKKVGLDEFARDYLTEDALIALSAVESTLAEIIGLGGVPTTVSVLSLANMHKVKKVWDD